MNINILCIQCRLSMVKLVALVMTLFTIIPANATALAQANILDENPGYYEENLKKPSGELFKMAEKLKNEDNIEKSVILYNIVANRYNEKMSGEELRIAVNSMLNLGSLYYEYFHQYISAYTYLNKAKEIATKEGYDKERGRACLNLAVFYSWANKVDINGEYTDSVCTMLKNAYVLSRSENDWHTTTKTIYNIIVLGYGAKRLNDFKPELTHFGTASDSIPQEYQQNVAYLRLFYSCIEAIENAEYEKALGYCGNMKAISDKTDNFSFLANYYSAMAEIKYKMGRLPEAVDEIEQLLVLTEEVNNEIIEMQCYDELSKYYEMMGNTTKSEEYKFKYYKLNYKLLHVDKMQSVKTMSFLSRLDTINAEQQKLINHVNEQNKKIAAWVFFAIVLTMMVVAMVLMYLKIKSSYKRLHKSHLALLEKESEALHKIEQKMEKSKYQNNVIDDGYSEEILDKIKLFLSTSPKVWEYDFSLNDLAEGIGVRSRDVSQTINMQGYNFNTLLADCRVNEACRLINSGEAEQLTIEALANRVGIKSRSSFSQAFKRVTGMTTSEYIRQAKRSSKR